MEFTFDPIAFLTQGAQLAPAVIFVVIAGTYYAESFGLKGNAQMAFALIFGFLLGGGLQFAVSGVPASFADAFAIFIYACVMAAVPKLIYDQAKDLIEKIVARSIGG